MIYLTRHEKAVLVVLAVVIACGSVLNITFRKAPAFTRWIDDKEHILRRTDVNRAGFDELVRVPYIGEKSANRIIEHREKFGVIASLAELGVITRLSPGSLEKAGKYLKFNKEG
jgi:predicted DNA-binding helix-hairpin-helix protein